MSLNDWLRALFTRPPGPIPTYAPDQSRAYVLGPAVVEESERVWGHDASEFSSEEYLRYAATSNAVYACAKLRASLLASLPLKFYKVKRGGGKTDVTEGSVVELFQKVNPRWTLSRWLEMSEWSLCLTGQTFTFLFRDGRRLPPREMWWGAPDRTKVIPHPDDYISGFIYSPLNGGGDIAFPYEQVFWMRYANPIDEFAGLAPLAAARLAADVASAAMKTNRNLFANGINLGGVISPATGQAAWSADQKKALGEMLNKDFKGVANAGRWGLFDREIEMKQWTMSPKDAEFLGAMKWSLEETCRAFGVPVDLIRGESTFDNLAAAKVAIWTDTMVPEARFFENEITEQVLPMFPGDADLCEFDLSGVAVLQEDEAKKWAITKEQITTGFTTINRQLKNRGEDPVPWGDAWWAPLNLVPIISGAAQEPPQAQQGIPGAADGEMGGGRTRSARAIVYGSPEHVMHHRRFVRRTDPWERKVADTTAALMRRQREEIVARLHETQRSHRVRLLTDAQLMDEIFSLPRWTREFRTAMRPVFSAIAEDVGQASLDDLGVGTAFDVFDPNVKRAIEQQAQRFATEVNETTWEQLRTSLGEGLEAGEGIDALAARVDAAMGDRIASSAQTIARSEVLTASTTGSLESARQSGQVATKTWLAAIDDRTREAHLAAHGQTVGLDDNFTVGGDTGPGPGLMGSAENDVNCRCSLTFGLTEPERSIAVPERTVKLNGHNAEADLLKLAKVLGVR